jgi:hypothetical protein
MKNYNFILIYLLSLVLTSCNNNNTKDSNNVFSKENNHNCKDLSIIEFNDKINIKKDTITFSCFNEIFSFNYEKLKLNDNFLFLPNDPIIFRKNNLNFYHAFFRCYFKNIDSCVYNFLMIVDSTKEIKYFSVKNYNSNVSEELFYTDSLLIDKVLGGIEKH